MHAISSYRGNRPTQPHTHPPTHKHRPTHKRTDRTDYNTLRRANTVVHELTVYISLSKEFQRHHEQQNIDYTVPISERT